MWYMALAGAIIRQHIAAKINKESSTLAIFLRQVFVLSILYLFNWEMIVCIEGEMSFFFGIYRKKIQSWLTKLLIMVFEYEL